MTNILLIFLNDLSRVEEFNKIIDKFDENNYKMYLMDNIIDDEDFAMDSLPEFVEFYKEQHDNVNKVVVLSNSRDLIFSWYRCFNSVVDDYIYFIDDNDKNFFSVSDVNFSFYYNLYEFNGVENETLSGEMFLSEENTMILPIFYNLVNFEDIKNYHFTKVSNKEKVNKQYIYNGYEYLFVHSKTYSVEIIKIGKINKRIVFIKGQSQYDVLRTITDYQSDYIKKLGFQVDNLDLLTADSNTIDEKLIRQHSEYFHSNNCVGIDILLNDGRNVYDAINTPVFVPIGDHPVNQLSRIINSSIKTQFICFDEENIKYFNKYFPGKKIMLNSKIGVLSKNYKSIKFMDRKIDILFAGTVINPEEIRLSWSGMDKQSKDIVNKITKRFTENEVSIDIDDEISKLFNNYNYKDINLENRAFIHATIERYIRYYKRYNLLKILGQSELEVLCIGNVDEYKKLNKSGKLKLRGNVSYEELLSLFNDSKIVVNMTGQLYNGITERILSAMINGAVVVTENDIFASNHFTNKENILLYDLKKNSFILKEIKYYLDNIEELEVIAKNSQDLAFKKYDSREGQLNIYRIMRELTFESK